MRIAFRADSSTEIGTGHIVRCLNLASALADRGASVVFVCRDLAGHVAGQVRERGYELALLPREPRDWESDAAATTKALGGGVDWLVVDSYALDSRWESRLRRDAGKILAIDDLADRPHDCDLLLDQNYIPGGERRYRSLVPTGCRLLLGPKYAVLSAALSSMGSAGRREGAVRRILVFFGGADPGNATAKALKALGAIATSELAIDVVLGAANPHQVEVRALAQTIPGATCHVQVSDMHERLRRADLALGAGGTSAWERCRAGLPSVAVAIAENQVAPSEALAEYGATLYLGPTRQVTPAHIEEAVRVCMQSPWLVRHLSSQALELVDGRGTARVADALAADQVRLRYATSEDCDRVFPWRNHEDVRRQFFDSRELGIDEHRTWFASALEDPSRVLLIAERGGEGVGVLRYDLTATEAKVSIYVAPGLGGRGLGTAILREGSRWMGHAHPSVRSLVAEILAANAASRRAFVSAGYQERSATLVFAQGASA